MGKKYVSYGGRRLDPEIYNLINKIPDADVLAEEHPDWISEKDKPIDFRGLMWGDEDSFFRLDFFQQQS